MAGPTTGLAPPLAHTLPLLGRAVDYTRVVLVEVEPGDLWRPTPCEGWDLGSLLSHMEDSLAALTEAADLGAVPLRALPPSVSRVPAVLRLQERACTLLGAWSSMLDSGISVGGPLLPAGVLAGVGALDVTVHGWDVSASLGPGRPIPPALAGLLLPLAHLLVSEDDRPGRFAPSLPEPRGASPGDRLLAFLGRQS